MNADAPQPVKPRFYDVFLMYELDNQALQDIADISGLTKSVVDAMFVSLVVSRVNAEKVLAAFSEYTGQTWTLETVKVALLPTFQDLHTTYNLDLATLSTHSGVRFAIIDMMLCDQPVSIREAQLVLQAASKQTGQHYTLDNVDVKLTEEK